MHVLCTNEGAISSFIVTGKYGLHTEAALTFGAMRPLWSNPKQALSMVRGYHGFQVIGACLMMVAKQSAVINRGWKRLAGRGIVTSLEFRSSLGEEEGFWKRPTHKHIVALIIYIPRTRINWSLLRSSGTVV
jgi:hypothetical protein